MTNPLVRGAGGPWTIDDLEALPDNGDRYELYDGSLLVSRHARVRHGRVVNRLRDRLEAQCPDSLLVVQDIGVDMAHRTTYFVPDIVVVRADLLEDADDEAYLSPADVELVVEVLSPDNKRRDLVLKRDGYARAGIEHYWIVDMDLRTVTALRLTGLYYTEAAVVVAGSRLQLADPFTVDFDPAEIF